MFRKLLALVTIFALFGFSDFALAQNMMCGKDLRDALDAQTLQQLEEAANKIKNGDSRFWKIEKDGVEPSYLLGTMHASDAKIVKMTSAEQIAFDKSSRVALELIDIGDEAGGELFNTIRANTNLLMYHNDDSVKKQMTEAQFQKFDALLKQRGIAFANVEHLKPWYFVMIFSMSDCPQTEAKVFDSQIELNALANGKELIGLETIEEQLKILARIPDPLYLASILQSINNPERMKDLSSTTAELYVEGKISMIMPLTEHFADDGSTITRLEEFNAELIDKRNVVMAERSKPLLEKGNSFIAVGALHLVGDTGLVEAFRKMGYRVTALK
ncbi:TraB/GumN family protein [Bartonella sp. HY329]|uniref:TraB/GumN family protein n=1 Tax=unclassified Bartonella TaxID=2645622 RepID=UPI0021C8DB93|nr:MULTISPECIES: TraB/GumN family protein [unclassified Bartonella]UXM94593.1 TraB/GumN family protein [Bartonella sp. HY329]UXN08916.1 TraB/GumN family protein [Bartonella sp. HY328]